jgi:hypothetical protein
LVAAIDRLLDDFHAFRLRSRSSVGDSDALHRLHSEVTKLALLAGFAEPPPLVEAGLTIYNPLAGTPPQNRDAGTEWEHKIRALRTEAEGSANAAPPAPQGTEQLGPGPQKAKRSTEPNEARDKIIAALTQHHQYEQGSCLNQEPIGNNELARAAGVAKSTVSAFFQKEFKGRDKYRAVCRDAARLAASLRLLRGEFSPHDLYGRTPPGEGCPDDDE